MYTTIDYHNLSKKHSAKFTRPLDLAQQTIKNYQTLKIESEYLNTLNDIENDFKIRKSQFKPILNEIDQKNYTRDYEVEKQRLIKDRLYTIEKRIFNDKREIRIPHYLLRNSKVKSLKEAQSIELKDDLLNLAYKLKAIEQAKENSITSVIKKTACLNSELNKKLTPFVKRYYEENINNYVELIMDDMLQEEVIHLNKVDKEYEEMRKKLQQINEERLNGHNPNELVILYNKLNTYLDMN